MKPEEKYQERLNYQITPEGHYVGQLANLGGYIVQAKSLEELERKMKVSMGMMLDLLTEAWEQPFDLKEELI